MISRWKYFIGSAFLAGALALKFGAPLFAVVLGIGLAVLFTERSRRRARASGAGAIVR